MDESTSPNEENAASPSPEKRERLLEFSPADMRLLIITIIGTVAGTLIAVMVVGLAIWAIHRAASPSREPFAYIFATIAAPSIFVFAWRSFSKDKARLDKSTKGIAIFALSMGALCVALIILIWVGFAAGISK